MATRASPSQFRFLTALAFVTVMAAVAEAQALLAAATISTIAGDGIAGYSGDGGLAVAAELGYPYRVVVDETGNVYFADPGTNRVRAIEAGTGTIVTIAGTGVAGFSGDGGPASSAQVANAQGVALWDANLLFIVDTSNNRVRAVNIGDGHISTFAGTGAYGFGGDGGPATLAQLKNPQGAAVDSALNLFICDVYNYRVRMVSSATGVITTIAGTGSAGFSGDGGAAIAAQLNDPSDIAVDGAGNIFIADVANSRVRKVTAGMITTFAGNGVAGNDGDGGPATAAQVQAYGVAVDAAGNVYIPNANNRIRAVLAATQTIATVAGSGGPAGFSGDGGPATAAALDTPIGIAVDDTGNVYFSDTLNRRIRKITPASPSASPVSATGSPTASATRTMSHTATHSRAASHALTRSRTATHARRTSSPTPTRTPASHTHTRH